VLQVRGNSDFLQKSFGTEYSGELRVQNFYRDFAIVLLVVREVNGCHPAAAQLTLHGVRAERTLNLFEAISGSAHVCMPAQRNGSPTRVNVPPSVRWSWFLRSAKKCPRGWRSNVDFRVRSRHTFFRIIVSREPPPLGHQVLPGAVELKSPAASAALFARTSIVSRSLALSSEKILGG
jgi:hypothetical protein